MVLAFLRLGDDVFFFSDGGLACATKTGLPYQTAASAEFLDRICSYLKDIASLSFVVSQ
jgi:hypothetical protein